MSCITIALLTLAVWINLRAHGFLRSFAYITLHLFALVVSLSILLFASDLFYD